MTQDGSANGSANGSARALLLAVRDEALARTEPRSVVRSALAGRPRPARVRVTAFGKAARAMLDGARDAWALGDDEARIFGGAHPIPDATSVAAAEAALAWVRAGGDATQVFLVSGGASAMLCAPWPDGSLALKRDVTEKLLRAGLDVASINVVRAHLSRIKGGWLAHAAGAAPQLTVVVSDVIAGDANAVGSGPTLFDSSTVDDALRIAAAAGLGALPFHETPKAPGTGPREVLVASSPEALARAAATALEARGVAAKLLPPSVASASALADEYAALARTLGAGAAVVRVAEPSLVVPPSAGAGGRSTHLAALLAPALPPGVAFMAAASDGVDGVSGTAGAIVDATLPDPTAALAAFATGPLHLRSGTALAAGATGSNYADLHVLVKLT